ncbi:hypothetical protein GJ496_008839 [Pomphorhynchus laevis]|nr:hypothetical protein GJ496_008839 [Pomphorhynchus laevis]
MDSGFYAGFISRYSTCVVSVRNMVHKLVCELSFFCVHIMLKVLAFYAILQDKLPARTYSELITTIFLGHDLHSCFQFNYARVYVTVHKRCECELATA